MKGFKGLNIARMKLRAMPLSKALDTGFSLDASSAREQTFNYGKYH
jgi:hypothetical protein